MNRGVLLPAAYLLDQIAGDPEWFPHPVRLIGSAISRGESALRRCPNQSSSVELICGAALTFAIVGSTYWLTAAAIAAAHRRSRTVGDAIELFLAWTCLAGRSLEQEAASVTNALTDGHLTLARSRLARIVGRDTAELDSSEISRAVIETVAESASDGVVAPLLYMAIGGVPFSMAYKAINTLDSMIGHRTERHEFFGWAAARIDDVANVIPARLTGLLFALLSAHPGDAISCMVKDAGRHRSINAGWPEAAMAGGLGVRLCGPRVYYGTLAEEPWLNGDARDPDPADVLLGLKLYSRTMICLAGLLALLAFV
jgi:adenosylcobinamide-phosphate synthase